MKKAVFCTALFHMVCFALMATSNLLRSQSLMNTAFLLDMVGAMICPILLAVVGGVSGIRDEVSVLKFYPPAAATVGAIGLARGLIFAFAVSSEAKSVKQIASVFAGAMKYLLISFLLLTIWFIIFEISRHIMNKGTKYNRVKKKTNKKS